MNGKKEKKVKEKERGKKERWLAQEAAQPAEAPRGAVLGGLGAPTTSGSPIARSRLPVSEPGRAVSALQSPGGTMALLRFSPRRGCSLSTFLPPLADGGSARRFSESRVGTFSARSGLPSGSPSAREELVLGWWARSRSRETHAGPLPPEGAAGWATEGKLPGLRAQLLFRAGTGEGE